MANDNYIVAPLRLKRARVKDGKLMVTGTFSHAEGAEVLVKMTLSGEAFSMSHRVDVRYGRVIGKEATVTFSLLGGTMKMKKMKKMKKRKKG